jgi:formamidase
MSGLGGLNKSSRGVVIGLVQLQLPVVSTAAELDAQCQRVCELVGSARRSMPSRGLGVFPE